LMLVNMHFSGLASRFSKRVQAGTRATTDS
jgi:hypothetical protein